jgi:hypothetical protein
VAELGAAGGVALHAASNWTGFDGILRQPRGQLLIGAGVLALGLSFLPAGLVGAGSGEPPFVAPARALARAPWPVLAQVAGVTSEAELSERLQGQGLPDRRRRQHRRLGGDDTRRADPRAFQGCWPPAKAENNEPDGGLW